MLVVLAVRAPAALLVQQRDGARLDPERHAKRKAQRSDGEDKDTKVPRK